LSNGKTKNQKQTNINGKPTPTATATAFAANCANRREYSEYMRASGFMIASADGQLLRGPRVLARKKKRGPEKVPNISSDFIRVNSSDSRLRPLLLLCL
jgi:hypothetical protein